MSDYACDERMDEVQPLEQQTEPEPVFTQAMVDAIYAAWHGDAVAAELAALREEIAALREEIAALRALLAPPSAVILTGPEVRWQFARLGCTCGTATGPDYCMEHAA